MTDALEQMAALLPRLTGVDVETPKKETAHAGVDEADTPCKVEDMSCPSISSVAPSGLGLLGKARSPIPGISLGRGRLCVHEPPQVHQDD